MSEIIKEELEVQGSITFANEVLATIAGIAAADIPGVAGMTGGFKDGVVEMIGKKANTKGLKIVIGEQDELYVDCNINIFYGQSIVTVAQAVQEVVSNALQSTAGLTVAAVNVNVCGIIRQQ